MKKAKTPTQANIHHCHFTMQPFSDAHAETVRAIAAAATENARAIAILAEAVKAEHACAPMIQVGSQKGEA